MKTNSIKASGKMGNKNREERQSRRMYNFLSLTFLYVQLPP